MLRLLFLLLLPLMNGPALAQSFYQVRVGTFQDVKADDFVELRELGFVYGQPREGQLTDVFLGNYTSQERAEEVVSQLRRKGFRNATAAGLSAGLGEEATYIQVALRSRNRSLDWTSLEQTGKLHVDATDGVTKVVTGPYSSAEAANKALADIRQQGYTDAFIRTIRPSRLIPVGTFETGIKKPLIPIQLRQVPPTAPATPPEPTPASRSAKADTAATVAPPAATNTVKEGTPPPAAPSLPKASPAVEQPGGSGRPAVATTPPVTRLPEIDGQTKRHSAAELQRVLKEKGFYAGSIDGYYGPGTTSAYRKAWEEMPLLRKFRLLADARPLPADTTGMNWPELRLLTTVAAEMAAGQQNREMASESGKQRKARLAATGPLDSAASSRVRDWENTLWKNLDSWAAADPLHAEFVTALRVGYYQSQARLEAMYQQRGLGAIEARNLATAALQNLVGADLARFSKGG